MAGFLAANLFVASAHPFAGIVSPARFELAASPGAKLAQILEIGNEAPTADEFQIHTADWELNSDGGVVFRDELKPGSCRPWVLIERRSIAMPPNGKRRYRFEVQVPADAPPQECRFAIVIESKETDSRVSAGTIQFPIQGRIGVIVYVGVGKITPVLRVHKVALGVVNGRSVPIAVVENSGQAHGRLEGVLQGTDAGGKTLEFNVSNFPILPGETRSVAIWPADDAEGKMPEVRYPVRLRGDLEWEGGKQSVNVTLGP